MHIIKPYISDEERGKKTNHKHNKHHKICKSRWWNNSTENVEAIYIRTHDAIHTLFGNLLPHEQMKRLMQINGSVCTDMFSEDLLKILETTEKDYFYKNGVWR